MAVFSVLLDMIEEGVDAAYWPVAEAIAILRREAERDHQIKRLLAELQEIEDRIVTLSPVSEDREIVRWPAG